MNVKPMPPEPTDSDEFDMKLTWLLATHDMKVSIGCLWKRLRHLGLTRISHSR